MKRLIFKREECETEEYLVLNNKKQPLGDVAYWKCLRKKDWWFFPHFHPMDGENDFWLGEDCLREITDFIKELKDAYSGGQE